MNADDLLSRSLKILQGAIRASAYTQTDVDEKIGRRRGYLSHVFQRRVDLKIVDLLRALQTLDIDPRRFFEAAAGGRPEERPALGELLQLLAGGSGNDASLWRPSPPEPVAEPQGQLADDPQLMARVREAVVQIVTDLKDAHPASDDDHDQATG